METTTKEELKHETIRVTLDKCYFLKELIESRRIDTSKTFGSETVYTNSFTDAEVEGIKVKLDELIKEL